MITNYGRVLFWELSATQAKNPVEQRSHFEIAQCTRICNANDLKQSRVVYYDAGKRRHLQQMLSLLHHTVILLGILCDYCLREFDVALELSFHSFSKRDNLDKILRVQTVQSFVQVVKRFIYQSDEQTSSFLPGEPSTAPFTVAIVSTYWDKVNSNYKHDTGLEPLEYLIDIAATIAAYSESFEACPDAFIAPKDTRPPSMRGFRDRDICE
jgi:hypothetical protein